MIFCLFFAGEYELLCGSRIQPSDDESNSEWEEPEN